MALKVEPDQAAVWPVLLVDFDLSLVSVRVYRVHYAAV